MLVSWVGVSWRCVRVDKALRPGKAIRPGVEASEDPGQQHQGDHARQPIVVHQNPNKKDPNEHHYQTDTCEQAPDHDSANQFLVDPHRTPGWVLVYEVCDPAKVRTAFVSNPAILQLNTLL